MLSVLEFAFYLAGVRCQQASVLSSTAYQKTVAIAGLRRLTVAVDRLLAACTITPLLRQRIEALVHGCCRRLEELLDADETGFDEACASCQEELRDLVELLAEVGNCQQDASRCAKWHALGRQVANGEDHDPRPPLVRATRVGEPGLPG